MITFSKIGQHGRLGNQLYQYAALLGLANKVGVDAQLPPLGAEWHNQKCLLDNFNISCGSLTETPHCVIYEPCPAGSYSPSIIDTISDDTSKNFDLFGMFQNTKYFYDSEDEIRKQLTPKDSFMGQAKEYVDSIRSDGKEIVSIHIRRGDNTDGTNPDTNMYSDTDIFDTSTIFGSYLTEALKHFSETKYKFLLFTGGSRSGDDSNDIQWVKNKFDSDRFVVSDSNDPMVDFSRIMCCDHNVLSHMTSFGWWAAYLNTNDDKQTVVPKDYHLDGKQRDGFFPKEWILL